ncbi:MAG: 2-hydroxyacyl-CoA dehydratase [Candidatus Helarchaeota archaeon]|nr:2-hydroxyacyl-CoA dehydratase [Candidatus Helarchaeota archaeon]
MDSKLISEAIEVLSGYKEEGIKIVGIVPHGMFPDELVVAAGAIPIHLILGGKDEQELGDQYLSATTCPYGRSTLGFLEKKHPLYSLIDALIVGTFCNGVQNVANYLYYFQIPGVHIILPHDRRDSSFNFYMNELRKIQTYLENLTGNQCTSKTFSKAIQAYNQMRALLRNINDYRKLDNPPVRGMTIHQLICQAFLLGPKTMISRCQEFLEELKNNPPQYSGTRVFLTGSGITLGDSILEIIEDDCGGVIVADDLWSSMDYFLEDVNNTSSNPLSALTDKYLRRCLCGRMIPESEIRIPKVLEIYHSFHASGVINHTLKFCDSYSNLKPEFKKIMNQHNIPVLDLDRDYAESNVGQIQTRVEAFLEMIA